MLRLGSWYISGRVKLTSSLLSPRSLDHLDAMLVIKPFVSTKVILIWSLLHQGFRITYQPPRVTNMSVHHGITASWQVVSGVILIHFTWLRACVKMSETTFVFPSKRGREYMFVCDHVFFAICISALSISVFSPKRAR